MIVKGIVDRHKRTEGGATGIDGAGCRRGGEVEGEVFACRLQKASIWYVGKTQIENIDLSGWNR